MSDRDRQRRLGVENRLAELNTKFGPVEDVDTGEGSAFDLAWRSGRGPLGGDPFSSVDIRAQERAASNGFAVSLKTMGPHELELRRLRESTLGMDIPEVV